MYFKHFKSVNISSFARFGNRAWQNLNNFLHVMAKN